MVQSIAQAVLLGTLITLVESSIFRECEEWINVGLGAWLIASTWVLGIATPTARIQFVLVGALVAALALYEMWHMRRNQKRQT